MAETKKTSRRGAKKVAAGNRTVEAKAEDVMLDGKTSLADVEPELAGQTVNAELPDMNDPEQVAEQKQLAREFEEQGSNPEQTAESKKVSDLEKMVRDLQTQLAAQKPQVVQVMADTEKVVMRFQSECADDNLASFGPGGMYGQVTGKTGNVVVPKSEWSRFLNEQVRYLLDTRKLIVLSGLDDDEREMYGVMYREGELLDQRAFNKLLDMGRDLIAVFPALCDSHKEMIARRFLTAYQNGDQRARDRELIVALNELSKDGGRRKGMFTPLIREINAQDETE